MSYKAAIAGIIIGASSKTFMEQQDKLLKDYTNEEKTAYLNAIAAIATADRSASEDELKFLEALAESAELSEPEAKQLQLVAVEPSTEARLQQSLDVLKGSDLRFSLLTDLITFAEADQNYSAPEKQHIEHVAKYLDIDQQQLSTINQFVSKAATTEVTPEAAAEPHNFLKSLGMENQFKNAGMNFGNISKGLLGMLAPFILGKLFSGRKSTGGGLGGLLGGLLGSGGGMLGGGRSGGVGSLISMLSGGRGMGNLGGMFGRMFG
jgi:uncharacterized tellurite resistance protein B-like protein